MGRVFGYARVSTLDQNLDRQLDMLNERGAEVIFTEKISGMKRSRPELNTLLAQLNAGDTVVVESLSRLGRSTKDLIELMELFQQKGVHLVSLKESIITSTASGKLLFSIFSALAQFERDTLVERTNEGLRAAKARGHVGGRPRIDPQKIDQAIRLYHTRQYTIREIEALTGVRRATLYQYLNMRKEGGELYAERFETGSAADRKRNRQGGRIRG
jgi:DNA invertase Pin-like site-specific DNA recombinase